MNPPGVPVPLDYYHGITSFGPPQAFGDAQYAARALPTSFGPPQAFGDAQYGTGRALPTSFGPPQAFGDAQYGTARARPTLQIMESHAQKSLQDQRAPVTPLVKYHHGKSRATIAVEDDTMAVPPQAGMIFPPSGSIFQPPRGPPVPTTPKPSTSTPMKRAANSNDTPRLQNKRSRIGSPGLRGERSAGTQQRIEGIRMTLEDRQNEERQKREYESRMLVETGRKLAEDSNQAADNLRKANAKLHQHLVTMATKAHEKLDAQADLISTGNMQREQDSVQQMDMLHNLKRMEEAIKMQDEKIEKLVQKSGKKK